MWRCTGRFLKSIVKGQVVVYKRTTFDSSVLSSFGSAESALFHSVFNQYKSCLRNKSPFYVSCASHYAKTKYSLQNAYDRLINGKKEVEAAQVAFMITKESKERLVNLGYDSTIIATLKPSYAQYIISENLSHETWKSDRNRFIAECERKEEEKRKKVVESMSHDEQQEKSEEMQLVVVEEGKEEGGRETNALCVVSDQVEKEASER